MSAGTHPEGKERPPLSSRMAGAVHKNQTKTTNMRKKRACVYMSSPVAPSPARSCVNTASLPRSICAMDIPCLSSPF